MTIYIWSKLKYKIKLKFTYAIKDLLTSKIKIFKQ